MVLYSVALDGGAWMLMVKMFTVGLLATNCYVINCKDTLQAAVIDPGFVSEEEAQEVLAYIKTSNLDLKFIIDTHGHPDHTCGNSIIKERFHTPICIHKDDAYMLGESGIETARYFGYDCVSPPADILLNDGDYIKFGDVTLRVMTTPGHSFGSMVLLGETEVFTGDTLFAGSIGRTDFPASSEREMQLSLRKLLQFPDYFVVYPGHGPVTRLGEEKRVNPFLRALK
jgi:glyoxylase-like metal-dependent hydrolase (beta-lactamase superfamily II)